MAVSGFHFRSVSLPSRVQPINASKIESHLRKFKSFQVSNSTSQTVPIITSQAIQSDLQVLAEMYTSVEEAAKSSAAQPMEESLEWSVELLDSCNTIRELLQTIKENVQALQSALRRKGIDSGVQNDIITYTCFRKKINKSIAKTFKTLKNLESKNGSVLSLKGSNISFIRVFREAACLAIVIFKCVLLFLSWPTAKPVVAQARSIVSRMVLTNSVGSARDNKVVNEVGSVDFAVRTLHGRIRNSDAQVIDVQILQRELRNLDACVEEFEGALERLFRLLVRCRVAVLNILTDQLK